MKANPRDVCFEGPTKFEMMCCFQGHKQGLLKQCGIAIPPTLYTRDKHGQLTHILDYLSCQLYIIRLFECATFLLLLVAFVWSGSLWYCFLLSDVAAGHPHGASVTHKHTLGFIPITLHPLSGSIPIAISIISSQKAWLVVGINKCRLFWLKEVPE